MNRILITGVAGFIGSHVAQRFVSEGYEVIGIDDLSNGNIKNIPEDIEFIEIDLSDNKVLEVLPVNCNKILHLAGQSSGEISFDNPVIDLNKNTVSTLNLIQYGIQNQTERIVYASSMSVYGSVPEQPISEDMILQPLSCYGIGKMASENYLRIYQKSLPFVSMRMFNVYGPGQDMNNLRQGMVSIYLAQALKNQHILVKGSINRFRDFIYIDDVVEAWWRASIEKKALNQMINIGTGIKTTVEQLLDIICNRVNDTKITIDDPTLGDQAGIYADKKKLQELLDLTEFTELEQGLSDFIEWAGKS